MNDRGNTSHVDVNDGNKICYDEIDGPRKKKRIHERTRNSHDSVFDALTHKRRKCVSFCLQTYSGCTPIQELY